MKLAVYLAKEVAAILRAVLTHETKKLYNDSTVHLLCSNYWVQPIYQELLHSSSRRNATRECERKRPSSGLARVTAYAKPPKQRRRLLARVSVTGLEVPVMRIPYRSGFPAHWAPVVLQQLQKKEDRYRAENPSWMDEEVAPADIPKQWQEARANRRMQFKVGNYRGMGSWESNIRLLTGTIKVDWIQLPVEQYLAALPTLKQGVIAGVFRQKGAAPLGDYQRGEVATLSLSSQ